MKRVAKFEKVSFERFKSDWKDTFGEKYSNVAEDAIKYIYDNIKLPVRATKYSAGYDFFSPDYYELKAGATIKIPTGIRCWINTDWVLMAFPRSSLGFKYQICLCNTTAIIDADYYYSDNEGHIFIKLTNKGDKDVTIDLGSAFIQGIFLPYGITDDDCVKESRNGGIGSTNKKDNKNENNN